MPPSDNRLHPDVVDYMAALEKLGLPAAGEATADELRAATTKRRLMIRVPVENVGKVYAREFTLDGRTVPVRVYEPERGTHGNESRPPLRLVFHGGGWVVGDPDTEDVTSRGLCKRVGAVVVSVDYGLAPEYRYPVAAEECYAAVEWSVQQADELGADSDRVAVAGTSAGGNLAAVVCQMTRDRGGPVIAHQVLLCPVTDYGNSRDSYRDFATGFGLTRDGMDWFWEQYLGDRADRGSQPYASPLQAADLSGLPDATVIVAECDVLRDEGEEYAHALTHAGVDARLTRYEGMIHGFNLVLGLINAAEDALDEAADRIKSSFAAA